MTTQVPALNDAQKAEIKDIVCDILELELDEVSDVSLFKEEHDADSLRTIEILASLERTFGITLKQSELSRMVNLTGVYAVVAEAKAQ
ncbi:MULTISPECIES: acyl carrier protein [unclassified Streptomyces]|jgi:acyl carrier protein|uniref:Acyl carrier protein n=1 Tax=Streptomyces evansiae TaxID=3075535 RepID=A0ABD5DXX3_9ACTN|nr:MULTISPECIES: acyl carrier protein [unclassified Streptomyces]ASY35132.1 polyketide-8 synthase acyl carrier protein [Streptomyces sp. CLI2509]EFK99574.1 acyl carrier protein [Streptomyces sp. SPB78]MDT0407839.1 acyl carrier protein [Streptomyces sp. DSM 41979]MDT0413877.1 acyl carrier protein [Streptomyces sp. DSM 41982]MDT0424180.1 acyl carrier protein [Streptomyces sp. DSM 41859]